MTNKLFRKWIQPPQPRWFPANPQWTLSTRYLYLSPDPFRKLNSKSVLCLIAQSTPCSGCHIHTQELSLITCSLLVVSPSLHHFPISECLSHFSSTICSQILGLGYASGEIQSKKTFMRGGNISFLWFFFLNMHTHTHTFFQYC